MEMDLCQRLLPQEVQHLRNDIRNLRLREEMTERAHIFREELREQKAVYTVRERQLMDELKQAKSVSACLAKAAMDPRLLHGMWRQSKTKAGVYAIAENHLLAAESAPNVAGVHPWGALPGAGGAGPLGAANAGGAVGGGMSMPPPHIANTFLPPPGEYLPAPGIVPAPGPGPAGAVPNAGAVSSKGVPPGSPGGSAGGAGGGPSTSTSIFPSMPPSMPTGYGVPGGILNTNVRGSNVGVPALYPPPWWAYYCQLQSQMNDLAAKTREASLASKDSSKDRSPSTSPTGRVPDFSRLHQRTSATSKSVRQTERGAVGSSSQQSPTFGSPTSKMQNKEKPSFGKGRDTSAGNIMVNPIKNNARSTITNRNKKEATRTTSRGGGSCSSTAEHQAASKSKSDRKLSAALDARQEQELERREAEFAEERKRWRQEAEAKIAELEEQTKRKQRVADKMKKGKNKDSRGGVLEVVKVNTAASARGRRGQAHSSSSSASHSQGGPRDEGRRRRDGNREEDRSRPRGRGDGKRQDERDYSDEEEEEHSSTYESSNFINEEQDQQEDEVDDDRTGNRPFLRYTSNSSCTSAPEDRLEEQLRGIEDLHRTRRSTRGEQRTRRSSRKSNNYYSSAWTRTSPLAASSRKSKKNKSVSVCDKAASGVLSKSTRRDDRNNKSYIHRNSSDSDEEEDGQERRPSDAYNQESLRDKRAAAVARLEKERARLTELIEQRSQQKTHKKNALPSCVASSSSRSCSKQDEELQHEEHNLLHDADRGQRDRSFTSRLRERRRDHGIGDEDDRAGDIVFSRDEVAVSSGAKTQRARSLSIASNVVEVAIVPDLPVAPTSVIVSSAAPQKSTSASKEQPQVPDPTVSHRLAGALGIEGGSESQALEAIQDMRLVIAHCMDKINGEDSASMVPSTAAPPTTNAASIATASTGASSSASFSSSSSSFKNGDVPSDAAKTLQPPLLAQPVPHALGRFLKRESSVELFASPVRLRVESLGSASAVGREESRTYSSMSKSGGARSLALELNDSARKSSVSNSATSQSTPVDNVTAEVALLRAELQETKERANRAFQLQEKHREKALSNHRAEVDFHRKHANRVHHMWRQQVHKISASAPNLARHFHHLHKKTHADQFLTPGSSPVKKG
ncbi:unnamed protein product [Amoebophrya sp. A25]|nr:unnamed protein product [Amoebophrya sp. A25]|eukprot:GSA25T00008010001.1